MLQAVIPIVHHLADWIPAGSFKDTESMLRDFVRELNPALEDLGVEERVELDAYTKGYPCLIITRVEE